MNIEIVTAFFGEKYSSLIPKTLIPSLNRASNIPAMLEAGHTVKHLFYCPPENVFEPVGSMVPWEFNTTIAKQNHETLGLCYQDVIRHGKLAVIAPADHVFGQGLWGTIKDMRPGDYVVCPHPRVKEQEADRVAEFLKEDRPNWEFVNLCMKDIPHQMVIRGIGGSTIQIWRAFKMGRYWTVRFADPPPLAMWGQPWMLEAWKIAPEWVGVLGVMDHQLPDQALWYGHLQTVQDSRKFFWCELTDEWREVLPVPGGLKTNAMQYLDQLPVHWWFESTERADEVAAETCKG